MTLHIWEKFNIEFTEQNGATFGGTALYRNGVHATDYVGDNGSFAGRGYQFDASTGKYTLTSPQVLSSWSDIKGMSCTTYKYFSLDGNPAETIFEALSGST